MKKAIVILLFSTGVSFTVLAEDLGKYEWTVRFILDSETDRAWDHFNILGQLQGAEHGYDSNDVPELGQTNSGKYLSVVFDHREWGLEKKIYQEDYHPVAGRKEGDEWVFQVRSNDPYRDLSLTWVGTNTNMKNMVLVDLQDDTVVAAVEKGKTQVYHFRMSGPVREFAWRVLSHKQQDDYAATGEVKVKGSDKESDWLPLGWGQGNGNGYGRSVPAGLPDNPLAD